jgi:hypothetical protein
VVAKAGKKRRKQHRQEARTDIDGSINKQAGVSSTEHTAEVVDDSKLYLQLAKDHFKKLLEETCLNHANAVKHKLRDCSLMKSFMTTGSLSWGMEIDKAPAEGDAAPFPREDVIMTIFRRHPSLEKRRRFDPSTQTYICKNIYIHVHRIHAIGNFLIIKGEGTSTGWLEAVKAPDRLSVGLTNWHIPT